MRSRTTSVRLLCSALGLLLLCAALLSAMLSDLLSTIAGSRSHGPIARTCCNREFCMLACFAFLHLARKRPPELRFGHLPDETASLLEPDAYPANERSPEAVLARFRPERGLQGSDSGNSRTKPRHFSSRARIRQRERPSRPRLRSHEITIARSRSRYRSRDHGQRSR